MYALAWANNILYKFIVSALGCDLYNSRARELLNKRKENLRRRDAKLPTEFSKKKTTENEKQEKAIVVFRADITTS